MVFWSACSWSLRGMTGGNLLYVHGKDDDHRCKRSIYIDVRTPGKNFTSSYRRAVEEYDQLHGSGKGMQPDGKLCAQSNRQMEADMVVLAAAIEHP